MKTKNPWKKLGSKIVHKNPWYKVNEDEVIRPNGKKGLYYVVQTNGPSVFVVALSEKDEVYLIGQHRYTSGKYSWELPAGNSDGENILDAAKRELKEETGLIAKTWQKIGAFGPMNGVIRETAYSFIARELTQTKDDQKLEEGIDQIKIVPFKKAFEMINSGEIDDGQSIAALTQAAIYLKKV